MDSSTPEDLDESTSSSDAADVLIRSTALPFRGQTISDNRSVRCISIKPGCDGGVNISVKRLCEGAFPSMQVTTKTAREQEPAYVPPALPANKPKASSSEGRKAPPSNNAKVQSGDREVKHGPEEDAICKASSAHRKKSLSHSKPQGGSMLKGQDVLISQYSGHKEAVRAVLKQRSASAPLMREVKVQLLNRPASATHSPQGPQAPLQSTETQPAGPSTGDQGASAAALTAAALTVTAPLLKSQDVALGRSGKLYPQAQSELDSRLARFSEDLQRLQAGYGQVLRPLDDRSSALDQQLQALTQQRLQHLERIQQQQLELQNRLLGSALDAVRARAPGPVGQASAEPGLQVTSAPCTQSAENPGAPAPHTAEAKPVSGDPGQPQGRGKRSPQTTPSPRRFAPKPMSRNARARNAKERLVTDGQRAPRAAGGSGRLLEDILNGSKSPESTAQTAGGKKVTIATAVCQPEPSSSVAYSSSPGAPEHASVTARKPSCEHLCSGHTLRDPASDPGSVMERASGMLQDLGRLRQEMKSLLQESRQSPPPCLGSRCKLGDQNQPLPNQTGSALPGRAPPADALTDEAREPAAPPPPPPVSAGEDRGRTSLPPPRTPLPALLQKSKPPPSMFEDAGRALRRVRRHRKVLEENLEAVLRARNGEALNYKLEALCCNGEAKEVDRIRKTVDAWIGTLSKEVQAEIAREDFPAQRAQEDDARHASLPVKSRRAKDSGSLKEATASTQSKPRFGGKKSFPRGPQGQVHEARPKSPVPPLKTMGPHQPRLLGAPRSEEEDEEYLMKVYGKALYSGHRRTLKKGPYLRFNSPSPKSKPQRPRVVESVKGVKVKSAKTQTKGSLFPDRRGRMDAEPQYIFSPTREGRDDPGAPQTPLEGLLIPMAIPLGQPRVDAGAPQPSRVIISRQPVTVTTSIPPTSRKPQPKRVSRPNVVVLELQSEEKRTAQLQVQVLPGVDIDSVSSLSPTPSPPPTVRPLESPAAEGIAEEEETVYPGNDYLAVADIAQEPESAETHIELNGSSEPPTPMCHGPAYPPQPPRPAESILPVIQQRDALENRLVDWVEQQLMARMIAEMRPRPVPEAQSSLSQPDESSSSASDIVEAAGGGGLQYFVDAGVPVDSALIRQYVTDTLAETVTLMLGQRARERGPVSPPIPPDTAVPPEEVVPTPVPTPGSSPRPSDVQRTGESSPRSSPVPSEQGSSIESPPEIKPPEGQDPGPPAAERCPVATPNTTPVPTPPRVATPTAPLTPPSTDLAEHLNPWGGAELPLEEEVLHSESDGPHQNQKPVFMSVAEEEEPVSLVSVSPPPKQPSPPPLHAQTPPLPPEAPPSASSLSSKSSSSSPSVTETDTVGRLISEGELLLSSGPIAAARGRGLTLPAFNTSLSSSLHGVLDIDYDPPSEGQVLRGPRFPHHRDPVLSLLARMDQGPVLLEEVTPRPEGPGEEDGSAGELSEGQRPRDPVLTPHPLLRDHSTLSRLTAAPPPEQDGPLSPGQLTLPAGMTQDNGHADQNPAPLMDLEALTLTRPEPRGSEDQDTDSVAPAHGPAAILVRQYQEGPEDIEEPGALASTSLGQYRTAGVSVTLPSAGQDKAPASIELLETDSSENDGF